MISPSDILHSKILIVDDRQTDGHLLEQMLRNANYVSITFTTDPGAVCELHREHNYNLILLDLMMPGMDGFQVISCLKLIEQGGYLPVLVITAQPDFKLRALQAGAKDFISKPFEMAEVLARIHNMLEVRLLHEATRSQGKTLEQLALRDPLTELANRRLLTDRMSMSIAHAQRHKSSMAVIYLDLDGFKQINDTLGHEAGDALLKLAAQRMLAVVREEDTVARLGGDEFLIVLWHVSDTDDAAMVALKVIDALAQPYQVEGQNINVSASAGVAIYPAHGEDADTLTKNADMALYEAKHSGKNTYRIAVHINMARKPDDRPIRRS